jgi:DNA-directed RNA polymerase subunit beta'
VLLADRMRTIGYTNATAPASRSPSTTCDPAGEADHQLVDAAQAEVAEIENQYVEGLITDGERYNKVIDIWARRRDSVAKALMEGISSETVKSPDGKPSGRCPPSTRSSSWPTRALVARRSRSVSWPVCVA